VHGRSKVFNGVLYTALRGDKRVFGVAKVHLLLQYCLESNRCFMGYHWRGWQAQKLRTDGDVSLPPRKSHQDGKSRPRYSPTVTPCPITHDSVRKRGQHSLFGCHNNENGFSELWGRFFVIALASPCISDVKLNPHRVHICKGGKEGLTR
jgi:hypothetical protein